MAVRKQRIWVEREPWQDGPALFGHPKDQPCIVLGSARTGAPGTGLPQWRADLDQADALCPRADILCVNWAGARQIPERDIIGVATRHPEFAERFIFERELRRVQAGLAADAYAIHGDRDAPGVDTVWDIDPMGGTSALFAVIVAISLGYPTVVLAGVPLNGAGYSGPQVHDHWLAVAHILAPYVRSFSGFTSRLFGSPSSSWLSS